MSSEWQYQVRFDVSDPATAESIRQKPRAPALEHLFEILAKHRASPKCQFDAFAEYVTAAEEHGVSSEIADAVEADLQPLASSGLIARISKYDTNPANNPQPPERSRERG